MILQNLPAVALPKFMVMLLGGKPLPEMVSLVPYWEPVVGEIELILRGFIITISFLA